MILNSFKIVKPYEFQERRQQIQSRANYHSEAPYAEQRMLSGKWSALRQALQKERFDHQSRSSKSCLISRPAEKSLPISQTEPPTLSVQNRQTQKYAPESRSQTSITSSVFNSRISQRRQQVHHEPDIKSSSSSRLGQLRQLRRSHSK